MFNTERTKIMSKNSAGDKMHLSSKAQLTRPSAFVLEPLTGPWGTVHRLHPSFDCGLAILFKVVWNKGA